LNAPDGTPIDDALVVRFKCPESFTGEDIIELHLHGSPYVATRLMEIFSENGIRQALPGEFSFRAVRNGKMTVSQAQAVADLISAANDGAVSLALEKMGGSQNRLVQQTADSLRNLAVLGELGIDFADQDVEEVSLPRLKERLEPLRLTLSRLKESYDRGSRLQDGIKVAFLGLPNAGKSSFFNSILGEDRSIVSDIPGTTRDIVRERITLRSTGHSATLRISDTAGLRSSEDLIEQMGVERSIKAAGEADLVLFLVEASSYNQADWQAALAQWKKIGSPVHKTLGILTKLDLLAPHELAKSLQATASFGISNWVPVSSLTGQGIAEAADAIVAFCSKLLTRDKGEVLLTRIDQLRSITAALDCLERAKAVPELDLFAADVRQALYTLANLIGETPPDDILAQIFADFCIGK
jgi:tRNA modification GTPase